ncbi:MAG TPA: hypothetical protein VE911_09085 [Candidatus Nitrosopolaris sp.]|nr:hypothetical protein [Candidatus Nitrosopolaris sp.]
MLSSVLCVVEHGRSLASVVSLRGRALHVDPSSARWERPRSLIGARKGRWT